MRWRLKDKITFNIDHTVHLNLSGCSLIIFDSEELMNGGVRRNSFGLRKVHKVHS